VVRVLVDLELQRRDLGQHQLGEARVDQQLDAVPRPVRAQQLRELVADPLGGDDPDARGQLPHGVDGGVLDREPELAREPGCPEHPQRIIAERHRRLAGCGEPLADQVLDPAVRIHEPPLREPQRHRVHREVAPHQVVLDAAAELHGRLAGVGLVGVGAVRGDLDRQPVDPAADRAERATHVPVCGREGLQQLEDAVRPRVRGEVEVADRAAEERVPHRTADQGEFVARLGERGRQTLQRALIGQFVQAANGRGCALHNLPSLEISPGDGCHVNF
jgi:hypothetical protein